MLEWLAASTGVELGKLVLEQVLDLGKPVLEGYVQDFFKDCLKNGVTQLNAAALKTPMAEAVGYFIKRFIKELQINEVPDSSIEHHYKSTIKNFVQDKAVRPILGKAFEKDRKQIDYEQLKLIWTQQYQMTGWQFPADEFDWRRVGKEYAYEVKGIIKANADLRALLNTELLEEIVENTAKLSPGFDISKYRISLQYSYGYLKLHTLEYADQQRPIRLWNLFIEPIVREALPPSRFELPLDLKQKLYRQGQLETDLSPEVLEQYRQQYLQYPTQNFFDAFPDCQRAVILGDPGAGKSTLIQYLALGWVEGKTEELPLVIELREYAISSTQNFLDFLHYGCGVEWQFDQLEIHKHLQNKLTLVMFDGLDEVFDRTTQSIIIDDIIRFSQQYPKARVLVTSRIVGYNPEKLQHADFRHFTIQALSRIEIHEFIDRWYTQAVDNKSEQFRLAKRLKDAIARSKAIQNLSDNPLLLTMMAILNRRQELPRYRSELYDQASRVLLHNWDVDHKRLKLPIDSIAQREKQEMLRLVAYEMQTCSVGIGGNLVHADKLTITLTQYLKVQGFSEPREKANVLIQQLRERNFILCFRGADTYSFVHRTFLEYFCAEEIRHQFNRRGAEGGLTFEQLQEVFAQHWQDDTWHEVLQLICGMIDINFSVELISYLIEVDADNLGLFDFSNLFLASSCFSEIRNQNLVKPLSNTLLGSLKDLFKEDKLQNKARELRSSILNKAAVEISRNWPNDEEILVILNSLLQSGDSSMIQLIARFSEERPDALRILREFIEPTGKGIGSASHFSTLRSKITDIEVLEDTLYSLNLPFKRNDYVRGGTSEGRYQTVSADIVIILVGSYDIGFSLSADGAYDLTADLWGIAKAYNQTNLINTIYQVYGVKKSLKELKQEL